LRARLRRLLPHGREVGGDYFDFLDLGAGRLGLALGDISGKGVSAALLMASLQALLRSRAKAGGGRPASLVTQINESLVESTTRASSPRSSMRCMTGHQDVELRQRRHNPPLLLRAGTTMVSRLRPTGMALGFDQGAVYGAARETLAPEMSCSPTPTADRGAQRGGGGVRRREGGRPAGRNRHSARPTSSA